MNFSLKKAISVILCIVMTAMIFASCTAEDVLGGETEVPKAVTAKVDLNDSSFTFTYGELKTVLPADKLGTLFEEYDKLSDDITIELSYNEIVTRFSEDGLWEKVLDLLSQEEKDSIKANKANVVEYFVNKVNGAKSEKPITQYKESFWTNENTIKFTQDGNDTDGKVKTAAKFFDYFSEKGAGKLLPNATTEKGADLTDIMYLKGSDKACSLTADDVVSAVSSLAYETQTYTEKVTNEKGKQEEKEVKVVTGITRIITIVLKDDAASVLKAYSMHDKKAILDEMGKASSYFTVDDYSVEFDGCTITATFNAVTDNILSATYDKNMSVSTVVNGVGDLDYLGKQDLTFDCTDRMEYHFGWDNEAK